MSSNNVHTARVLEYMPRILQIAHASRLCRDRKGIPDVSIGGCEPLLTPMEADLVVDEVLPGGILHFHHNYLPVPVLEGVINVVVRRWERVYVGDRNRKPQVLVPHQTETKYCPSVLIGSVYAPNEAVLYGPRPNLQLEDRDGFVYEFPLSDVGGKLIPLIEECYLVTWNRMP
jgi:hypothetical protein